MINEINIMDEKRLAGGILNGISIHWAWILPTPVRLE